MPPTSSQTRVDVEPYFRAGAAVACLVAATVADAATFSFRGDFAHDTDVAVFSFTLDAPAPGVELRTFGYAGGVNGAGQTIAAGGFEPVLGLFLADGTGMNPGISGPCGGVLPADPATGACGDVHYPTTLSFPGGEWAAGTYTVSLSMFANAPVGDLASGFFAEAVLGLVPPANFTCGVGAPGFQGSPASAPEDGAFCDEYVPGLQRDGHWALDIVGVDRASGPGLVPLPASALLLVPALGCMFARRRALG